MEAKYDGQSQKKRKIGRLVENRLLVKDPKPLSHWAATVGDKLRMSFKREFPNCRGFSQFSRMSRKPNSLTRCWSLQMFFTLKKTGDNFSLKHYECLLHVLPVSNLSHSVFVNQKMREM